MDIRKYILLILLALAGVTQMQAQADRQFIRNGNKLYRQQNYAKAETEYRKALSKNARNTQAMYNLGCALMMQQKDSAAIVQLQNAGPVRGLPQLPSAGFSGAPAEWLCLFRHCLCLPPGPPFRRPRNFWLQNAGLPSLR